MINLGKVRPGSTIRIPFSTFDKDDGSSITMTNYAAADILIYKDGSTTERASTAGFTATTDFDAKTGKHVAIIDLADNTTAGFFTAGSEYLVAIDAVTVDGVTTGGWIARFCIGYEGSWIDTTIATLASQTSFTLTSGPAEDDALNGQWAIIHDLASAVQSARVLILDYTGSTKTVTLAAGATFTAAAGDNISVMGMAPLQPVTLGRTVVIDAAGLADANMVKLGPTGSGTAQTARDIGASVLLSTGTGTGQLDFTTGVVKANITQLLGTAWLTPAVAGTPDVNAKQFGGAPVTATTSVTIPAASTLATTAGAVGSVTGAVGSVTGAVGSVTGNVGGNVVGSVASVTAGVTLAASATSAKLVDDIWDEVLTGAAHNVASSAGRRLRTLDITLDSGTAQAGSADSITLATSASTTLGLYVGCRVYIDGGTGAGQSRYIVGYTTGRVAWVARSWTVTPDATSTYVVTADNQVAFVHMGLAQAGGASTITLDSGASATNDIYNGQIIRIMAGAGDNQLRMIVDYDGTTKVATVAPAWTTNPDGTSYFATLSAGPADVASINRTAQTARDIGASVLVSSGTGTGQLDFTSGVVKANVTQLAGNSTAATNAANGWAGLIADAGTAQAGAASTITLQSGASATNDLYTGAAITILSGTGAGQTRKITDYDGTTKVATVDTAWAETPNATSVYQVLGRLV